MLIFQKPVKYSKVYQSSLPQSLSFLLLAYNSSKNLLLFCAIRGRGCVPACDVGGAGCGGRRRSRSRGRPGPPTGNSYSRSKGALQPGGGADPRPALSTLPNLKFSCGDRNRCRKTTKNILWKKVVISWKKVDLTSLVRFDVVSGEKNRCRNTVRSFVRPWDA